MVELQAILMSSTAVNTSNDATITTTASSSSSSGDHSTSPSSPQPPSSSVVATWTTYSPQLIYYNYYYYYYSCYYDLPHLYLYPYPPPLTAFYLPPPPSAVVFIPAAPQLSNKPRRKHEKKSKRKLRNDSNKNGGKGMSKQIKMKEDNECTSVMIKNIPNSLRRRTLIGMLDTHCRNQNRGKYSCPCGYDFVYLPFDFKHEQNLGYAFVNFTSVEAATKLRASWSGKGWEHTCKIREITSAKFQGIKRLKNHFRGSTFRCVSVEYLPVEFSPPRDGFNSHLCKSFNIGRWLPPRPSH